MIKDYYGILEVASGASDEDLKKAYRRLAQEWHPDKHHLEPDQQRQEAEEKFKEISEAYATLSDPEKRANYDATGDPTKRSFNFRTSGDPYDIFSQLHRAGFGFRHNPGSPQPTRGQTIQLLHEISLSEALFGGEISLQYSVLAPCEGCGGRGAIEFDLCVDCKGSGHTVHMQPNMVIQQTCAPCGGSGQKAKTMCPACQGRRLLEEQKSFQVKLPPGLSTGNSLRLGGQGGRGMNGGPPGDTIVNVRVRYPDTDQYSEEEKETLKNLLDRGARPL